MEGTREKPLDFTAPALTLSGEISGERLQDRQLILRSLDSAHRLTEDSGSSRDYSVHQRKAFLLSSSKTTQAFDLRAEPDSVRERYGGIRLRQATFRNIVTRQTTTDFKESRT